jgi:hypothetical protein
LYFVTKVVGVFVRFHCAASAKGMLTPVMWRNYHYIRQAGAPFRTRMAS